jgi:hypothetical protein
MSTSAVCAHCQQPLPNPQDGCPCNARGAVLASGIATPSVLSGDYPLIDMPETDCPYCSRSLASAGEFCGCAGSIANRKPEAPLSKRLRRRPVSNGGRPPALITYPEKQCPYCSRSLPNAGTFCGCPGSIANGPPEAQPPKRPVDAPVSRAPIGTPERKCPHCRRSLVNRHQKCDCPASRAC